MARQQINTEQVAGTINQMNLAEQNINGRFERLQQKMSDLEFDWKSNAAQTAMTMMYEITKGNNARSSVMQNYIRMLTAQVNPGYIQVENVNTSLSDLFK
ncbi:MAG: hypothetical protein IK016_05400 [Lachnospiraceae bacterium]|nr:hypothetical protein [Lachnospiraceae bacterium]